MPQPKIKDRDGYATCEGYEIEVEDGQKTVTDYPVAKVFEHRKGEVAGLEIRLDYIPSSKRLFIRLPLGPLSPKP